MKEAYRLFRRPGPKTLFHGLNGSRTLPLDTILEADIKRVWNPGKTVGDGFISGFHILPDRQECIDYLQRFKNNEDIVVCKVYVDEFRDKPNSKVKLASKMLINADDWNNAYAGHTKQENIMVNQELIKLVRNSIPEQIAKDLVSVQPMGDIDYIALKRALENYQWICPHYGAIFNKKDTK